MLYIGITDSKKMGGGEEVIYEGYGCSAIGEWTLSPVGISEDNALGWEIVLENQFTVAVEASLLGQLWNFLDYLSALGIILRYNSEPRRGSSIL